MVIIGIYVTKVGRILDLSLFSYISEVAIVIITTYLNSAFWKLDVHRMSGRLSKFVQTLKKSPLARGMASYGIIWPTSSLIQQSFEGKNIDTYDWWRCARYGLYGSCYVAPTIYAWFTIASTLWPGTSLRIGLIKTLIETITYTPFAMCSFYFGMSALEMKPFHECVAEVKAKFLPTYKVGVSVWPAIALINFCLIPPKNRVPFISVCSLIWTCFLAYMKHLEKESAEFDKVKKPFKNVHIALKSQSN